MNKLTLFFLFAFLPIFMTAREIPRDKALKIAEDFLSPQMKTRSLQEPDLKMVYDGSSHDTRSSDHPAFYAFDNIAMNTSEYCHKGDIVGVKGRIQRIDSTSELQLIAEKVTFLSSKSPEE